MAVAFALRAGVIGLVIMVLGSWPVRYRIEVKKPGIRLRWMMFSEGIPWNEILAADAVGDSRRWVLGKRRRRIELALTRARRFRLDVPESDVDLLLTRIHSARAQG